MHCLEFSQSIQVYRGLRNTLFEVKLSQVYQYGKTLHLWEGILASSISQLKLELVTQSLFYVGFI